MHTAFAGARGEFLPGLFIDFLWEIVNFFRFFTLFCKMALETWKQIGYNALVYA